jgi:erythromycin esterase-like protein
MLLTCILIFAAHAYLAQQTSSSAIARTEAQLLEPSQPLERELRAGFDGLFFIDTTTRARPNH